MLVGVLSPNGCDALYVKLVKEVLDTGGIAS
jgi:hypothetical protein